MKLGVIYTPGFLRQRQAARRSHQVLSIVFLHKIDGQNLVRSTRLAVFLDNEKSHTTLKGKERKRRGREREKERETERERERQRRRNREKQRGGERQG